MIGQFDPQKDAALGPPGLFDGGAEFALDRIYHRVELVLEDAAQLADVLLEFAARNIRRRPSVRGHRCRCRSRSSRRDQPAREPPSRRRRSRAATPAPTSSRTSRYGSPRRGPSQPDRRRCVGAAPRSGRRSIRPRKSRTPYSSARANSPFAAVAPAGVMLRSGSGSSASVQMYFGVAPLASRSPRIRPSASIRMPVLVERRGDDIDAEAAAVSSSTRHR